jgi:hypothetical protein
VVLEDFGRRAGSAWRETDETDADLETVLQDILAGQYAYPLRIVCFNAIEGWSRDATADIHANATRPFNARLVLPLKSAGYG